MDEMDISNEHLPIYQQGLYKVTPPFFIVIVRTQGLRNELLYDALSSIAVQKYPAIALLTVHQHEDCLAEIVAICRKIQGLSCMILHAKNLEKKRGYPLNVGLQYCYSCGLDISMISFLDDDDIIYPFFTNRMLMAMNLCEADVIHAANNRRYVNGELTLGYNAKPSLFLIKENFIPLNSFAVRFNRLKASEIMFDEELDYLEDWHFLLNMMKSGFRFHEIHDALSEFRITSDGNIIDKRHPNMWKNNSIRIRKEINQYYFRIQGFKIFQLIDMIYSLEMQLAAIKKDNSLLQNKLSQLSTQFNIEINKHLKDIRLKEKEIEMLRKIMIQPFSRILYAIKAFVKYVFQFYYRHISFIKQKK